MSANVETMFSVRETPWHGLGRIVMDAPAFLPVPGFLFPLYQSSCYSTNIS